MRIFALCLATLASAQIMFDSRYGLTFSPTTISASRYYPDGQIEVAKFPAGPVYQQFYTHALRCLQGLMTTSQLRETCNGSKNGQAFIEMIRSEVSMVTASLAEQPGTEPEYATIFLPPIFGDELPRLARETLFPDGVGGLDGVIDYGYTSKVVCEGFGFLEGNQIGRAPEERNDEDGPQTFILVLEYEHDYLHAEVREIIWESERFPIVSERICLDCGERFREYLDREGYIQRVEGFLGNFIDEILNLYYHSLDRSDIRVKVLAGESTPSAFDELGAIALKAVGTSAVKLATGIDPSNVVAQGVAIFIRRAHRYKGQKSDAVNYDPYKESYAEDTHIGLKNHHDEL